MPSFVANSDFAIDFVELFGDDNDNYLAEQLHLALESPAPGLACAPSPAPAVIHAPARPTLALPTMAATSAMVPAPAANPAATTLPAVKSAAAPARRGRGRPRKAASEKKPIVRYRCRFHCPGTFKSGEGLRVHMAQTHQLFAPGVTPLKCSWCTRLFLRHRELNRHDTGERFCTYEPSEKQNVPFPQTRQERANTWALSRDGLVSNALIVGREHIPDVDLTLNDAEVAAAPRHVAYVDLPVEDETDSAKQTPDSGYDSTKVNATAVRPKLIAANNALDSAIQQGGPANRFGVQEEIDVMEDGWDDYGWGSLEETAGFQLPNNVFLEAAAAAAWSFV